MDRRINIFAAKDAAECGMLLGLMSGLVIFPAQAVGAASDTLAVCLTTVIPSLFPFFVITETAVLRGYTGYFGRALQFLMKPLFGLRGDCAAVFALGITGGYPSGARMTAAMYRSGRCTRQEAEYMLSFCNNCGPAFILGTVGAGIFGSTGPGIILYISHILSAMAVGVCFRQKGAEKAPSCGAKSPEKNICSLPEAFVSAVRSSVLSVLNVTGSVVFFGVALRLLKVSGITGRICGGSVWVERLLTGTIELSNGVLGLQNASGIMAVSAASFMLGWGGMCVHFQTLSELAGSGLSVKKYFLGKMLQGVISALMTCALCRFLLPDCLPCAAAVDTPAVLCRTPTALTAVSSVLFAALAAVAAHKIKKGGKKRGDVL